MASNDENRAKDALKKQAKFGEDIDLDSYHDGKRDIAEMESLEDLPKDTKATMHDSGLTPSGKGAPVTSC